jgi:hypothetical protein
MPNFFPIYQGSATPQYTVNLSQIVSITHDEADSWTLWMTNGDSFTLEEEDLTNFKKTTGL